jgi:hypothetical protein
MTSGTPPRVRVTSPRTGATRRRPVSGAAQIDDQTDIGAIYMTSLLRSQLRLALGVMTALGLTLGMLPVLFAVLPASRTTRVAGIPLPWLLLGVVVYPFLVGLGWCYVRLAERNEEAFVDLVERR